ncbi:hypothetical protein [Paenibacillus taihuensis]|nr:hypothetical protein [Paenibacillus taihuensis]
MIILYAVNTIFDLSIFAIVHINLNWISVNTDVEQSLADLVLRLIMIPLVMVMVSNILLYSWKWLKWIIVIGILLLFIPMQFILQKLDILKAIHWNIYYTLCMFSLYIIFSSLMTLFITRFRSKEVKLD